MGDWLITTGGDTTLVVTEETSFTLNGEICAFASQSDVDDMNEAISSMKQHGYWPGKGIRVVRLRNMAYSFSVDDKKIGIALGIDIPRQGIPRRSNEKRLLLFITLFLVLVLAVYFGIGFQNYVPLIK